MSVVGAFVVNMLFNFASGLLAAKFLGPEQFGRFALAIVMGAVIQLIALDWIRLSAVRFYSAKSRADQPELRAMLNKSYRVTALMIGCVGVAIIAAGALGVHLPPSPLLLALACAVAITTGLFDYSTALAYGRFQENVYLRLTLTKNVLALALVTGAAFVTGSAYAALVGMCVSITAASLLARRAIADTPASTAQAYRALALQCARYSLPIVAANLLYLLIPLVNRGLIAAIWGYAETGLFSLAYDVGVRLVGALAMALDILLFQIAVRTDETSGRAAAQAQVARNTACMFAVLLPCSVGLWLTLPSVEALIVPSQFHGAFSDYLGVLLPGMFCFSMCHSAINATFQIDRKTWPLIAAALIGCVANLVLFLALKGMEDAHAIARAQSLSFVAAFLALLWFAARNGAHMPRVRDLVATCVGVGVMAAVVLPMRDWEPGLVTGLAQAGAGLAVYGAFVVVFDIARMRSVLIGLIRDGGLAKS